MVIKPSMHTGLAEAPVLVKGQHPADVGGPVGGVADAPAPPPGVYDEFTTPLSNKDYDYSYSAYAPGELPAYACLQLLNVVSGIGGISFDSIQFITRATLAYQR